MPVSQIPATKVVVVFVAFLALLFGCNENRQGGRYTYSYDAFDGLGYRDTIFKADNDSLAYIWAQEMFYAAERAACCLYEKLGGETSTIALFPKDFLVKKGNRLIKLEGLKSPSLLEAESIAYKGARFGMSIDEVKAIPEFAEWIPGIRDEALNNSLGCGPNLLCHKGFIGDYYCAMTMEFNKDEQLRQIDFETKGSIVNGTIKQAREQFLYMLRSRYGLSDQDIINGRFIEDEQRYQWNVGGKVIILSTVQGAVYDEIKVRFFSIPITNSFFRSD